MKDYEQRERDLANMGHKDLIRFMCLPTTGYLMTAEASENIEKLVSILLTFSPEQMAEFVAGAREIIAQYTPKN